MKKISTVIMIMFFVSMTMSSCEKSIAVDQVEYAVDESQGMEGSVTIINTMLSGIQGQLDLRNAYYEIQSQEWKDQDEEGGAYQRGTTYLQEFWDDNEQKMNIIERDNWEE